MTPSPPRERDHDDEAAKSIHHMLQLIFAVGAAVVGLFMTFETKADSEKDRANFWSGQTEIKKSIDELTVMVRTLYDKELARDVKERLSKKPKGE